MGVLKIHGALAWDALNSIVTRDLSKCSVGEGAYTLICHEDGGCVDDLIAYRIAEDTTLLVVNASNREKDLAYLKKHFERFDIQVDQYESDYGMIAVQGPKSFDLLNTLGVDLENAAPFSVQTRQYKGSECLFFMTGYTGEKGCEALIPNSLVGEFWRDLVREGSKIEAIPCGLGARDTLRLEMGYSLYGHELTEEINPIEAGLKWAVGLQKDTFVGKDAIQKALENPKRKLVAICNDQKRAPRAEMNVAESPEGAVIGKVTSGTFSPSLTQSIGLCLVDANTTGPYYVDIRGKWIEFQKSKRPFYKK